MCILPAVDHEFMARLNHVFLMKSNLRDCWPSKLSMFRMVVKPRAFCDVGHSCSNAVAFCVAMFDFGSIVIGFNSNTCCPHCSDTTSDASLPNWHLANFPGRKHDVTFIAIFYTSQVIVKWLFSLPWARCVLCMKLAWLLVIMKTRFRSFSYASAQPPLVMLNFEGPSCGVHGRLQICCVTELRIRANCAKKEPATLLVQAIYMHTCVFPV